MSVFIRSLKEDSIKLVKSSKPQACTISSTQANSAPPGIYGNPPFVEFWLEFR